MLPGSSRLYSQTLGNVAAEAAGRAQAGRSQKTGACSETAVRIRTFIISRAHRTEGLFDFCTNAEWTAQAVFPHLRRSDELRQARCWVADATRQ
jgi:hypothetical protein